MYRQSLILYGCGDFINDYEGISGYEEFRSDLTIMYLPQFDGTNGHLIALEMAPMQIRRFRLNRASHRLDTKFTMGGECNFTIDAGRT